MSRLSVLRYFADWHGSIHSNPPPGLLESRLSAIQTSIAEMDSHRAARLVSLYLQGDADQARSDREDLVQQFSEVDKTFPAGNNANLVNIMLAGCVAALLDGGGPRAATVAIALQTTTIGGKAHQIAQVELMPAALRFLAGEGARVREEAHADLGPMPDFGKVAVPADVTASVEEIPDGQWPLVVKNDKALAAGIAGLQKSMTALAKATTNLRSQTVAAFGARPTVRDRAVVALQEETQILWWLFGEWSEDAQRSFKDLTFPGASLLLGCELAQLIRFVPGHPRVAAIIAKAVHAHPGAHGKVSLAEVISDAKLEWRKRAAAMWKPDKMLTPVMFAIDRSAEAATAPWHESYQTVTGVSPQTLASPAEWAQHLLDEILLLRVLGDAAS